MGMFKDIRKMQKAAKQYERPKMRDAIRMGAEAMEDVQAQQQLAQDLATNGVDGRATVKSLEATGRQVNYQPELKMELAVEVNGFSSDITHVQVVSPAVLPQLQPGATVACKVDPNDHSRLLI
ncbi:MAG TPA: hypothetical protein VK919_06750 [Solirubrobacterales bacterium]|nr:hypothetical protein [Solirubrobacterales bacterium]